jgi:hypothetical protein
MSAKQKMGQATDLADGAAIFWEDYECTAERWRPGSGLSDV